MNPNLVLDFDMTTPGIALNAHSGCHPIELKGLFRQRGGFNNKVGVYIAGQEVGPLFRC